MDNMNLLTVFIINIGALWLFLGITTRYQTSNSILKKKGYDEEYIEFIKKDAKSRNLGIAIAMPIIELLAALVVWLIFGELNTAKHLPYIALFTFIFIIPFPIMDLNKSNKAYKKLAVKTKSNIVVDVNYQILHLIFKPRLELTAGILYIVYFALFNRQNVLGIIHLIIVWVLYMGARSWKNMIRQSIKDGYLAIFIIMVFNHVLVMYHFVWRIFRCFSYLGWIEITFGAVLAVLLVGKLIYYCTQIPRFKSELSMQSVEKAPA